MILHYYGMREHPFGVTPNPHYLYLSPTHREALATLIYGIEADRGFMALIAKPGMGKTTLLFELLERLGNSARTVFLFQTQCDSCEFFRYLLLDMGIDSKGQDLAQMHDKLNQALVAEAQAGRRFILIIDEAQNLADSVLETVRLLSDFETPRAKLLQIILAGQPQLAEKLARPELVQLRQRISFLVRLEPFSPEETQAYIDHRLKVAGYTGPGLFTTEAREMIAARGNGIPRDINNICFNAMSLGFVLQKKIDDAIVQEVLADLNLATLIDEAPARQTEIEVQEPTEAGVSLGAQKKIDSAVEQEVPAGRDLATLIDEAPARQAEIEVQEPTEAGVHLRVQKKFDFAVQEVSVSPNLATLIDEAPVAPKTTPQTEPAVQEPIERKVQRGAQGIARLAPAFPVGGLIAAFSVTVCLALFFIEKPKSGDPPSLPQTASASSDKATSPSRVDAEPADAKPPAPPRQGAGLVPHPLPSVPASVLGRSKGAPAESRVRVKRTAKVQKGTQEPQKVRTVPHVPAIKALPSSEQTADDATSAVADPVGETGRGTVATYRQAVQQSPSEPATHHNLARALQAEGDLNGAAVEYRQALRLAPTHAESHIGLGTVLLEKGNFDGAFVEFQAAERLKPDDPRAHYNAGLVLYAKGDPASLDTAKSEYREAIRLRPNDADIHYALGAALFRQGNFDAAISEYREALRLAPDRALVREQLRQALLQKGDGRQRSQN
jgi:type II secretory pathway predicted ATPase ExeA/Flp pilus assembly protein TadD